MGMKAKPGFTLLELVMVLIILGILISLGEQVYFKTVERARQSEALKYLGQIRMALIRYYAEHAVWISSDAYFNSLDITPPDQSFARYFEFHLGDTPDTSIADVCYANRTSYQLTRDQPYVIGINRDGTIENTYAM